MGYKVHLAKTCALEASEQAQEHVFPQLITVVQATVANVQDVEMTQIIQEDLASHTLFPEEHDCTKFATTDRVVHVRPQAAHEALQARRHEQETPEFRQAYQTRAGIEGTLSQAVRRMGIRRARYDGLHKTLVQHVITAVAIKLVRIDAALTSTPRGKTRQSRFMRLALHPALQHLEAA